MSELAFTVSSTRAPLSTQFWEVCKGIEQCYYALVFLADNSYEDGEVWRSWARMGFHLGIKSPPPGCKAEDVSRMDMRLEGTVFQVTVVSSNDQALKELGDLLLAVNDIRPAIQAEERGKRVAMLLSDPRVSEKLSRPLEMALDHASLYQGDLESFQHAFARAFAAMTDPEIVGIELV